MKKTIFLGALILMAMACPQMADAQQFTSVSPSGHTLWYALRDGTAAVVGNYNDYIVTLTGDLVIPDSVVYNGDTLAVTEIHDSAFINCAGLTSVQIPNTMQWIGGLAFKNCTGLTSITIPPSVTRIGIIPTGVESGAFQGCRGLKEVNFNADSCLIMSYPFIDCDSLTTLNIGDNVTAIPQMAFYGCSALTSLFIPASVTHIGIAAFHRCGGLESIVVDAENPVYDSRNNCNAIIETATGVLVRGCHNTVIPEDVHTIGHHAFSGCTQFTSFVIPDNIEIIGMAAFSGCTGIANVHIPSSVSTINNGAFSNCEALTSVTVPPSVTSLGQGAFAECYNLTSAVILASVTSLQGYTFRSCRNLTSVTLPETITALSKCDFFDCERLANIDIPDGVTYIGDHSFNGCSQLTSITLPAGLAYLGEYAFFACYALSYIRTLAAEVPESPDVTYMFVCVPNDIPIYVPCGSSTAYDTTWRYFTNYIEEMSFTYEILSANNNQGSVQIQSESTVCDNPTLIFSAEPADGYVFDHWSDGNTENPRSIQLTQDTVLTAYFATSAGIGDVEVDGIRVYAREGHIVVDGAQGENVSVYDMMGRQLNTGCQALNAGVYMVKIGQRPARKIVVTR